MNLDFVYYVINLGFIDEKSLRDVLNNLLIYDKFNLQLNLQIKSLLDRAVDQSIHLLESIRLWMLKGRISFYFYKI